MGYLQPKPSLSHRVIPTAMELRFEIPPCLSEFAGHDILQNRRLCAQATSLLSTMMRGEWFYRFL